MLLIILSDSLNFSRKVTILCEKVSCDGSIGHYRIDRLGLDSLCGARPFGVGAEAAGLCVGVFMGWLFHNDRLSLLGVYHHHCTNGYLIELFNK